MRLCFWLLLLGVFGNVNLAFADSGENLDIIHSPQIQGNVLYVKGVIGSHIYDYLAIEAKALKNVTTVDLNSYGGNSPWAIEIGRKMQEMGFDTRLSDGSVCASACVYLFGSGKKRLAGRSTWLGIHGARLGAGHLTTFWGVCFVDLDDGSQFFPEKKGCQAFLKKWYADTMEMTLASFALIEKRGVSPRLKEDYFSRPDDPKWPAYGNVLRTENWELPSPEALDYALVTELLP